MSKHTWFLFQGNAGNMGDYEVWQCSECGACENRPMFSFSGHNGKAPDDPEYGRKPPDPFYPNGSGLKLTMDCQESQRILAEAKNSGKYPKHLRWDLTYALLK